MTESTTRIALWGSVILGIIILVMLLAMFGSSGTTSSTELSRHISSTDHIKGSADAKVNIVEYSDFQCPACAGTYPLLKQVTETYSNDVTLAYRHFPLSQIHAHATRAAEAAEAASLQGAFWDMHDVLFNTQAQWSSLDDPTDFFISLANSLGLDTERFQTDLDSDAVRAAVKKDSDEASSMNLPGTPSIFINGTLISNPGSYDGFTSLIDAALAQ